VNGAKLEAAADLAEKIRRARADQALRILDALERWGDRSPGRGFSARRGPDGNWQVTLLEVERRTSGGESLADALAQSAQTVSLEMAADDFEEPARYSGAGR
jgi:hypothetical protein